MFNIYLFDRLKKNMGLKIVANKECREKTRSPEMLSIPWGGGGEGMGAKLEAKPFSLPSVM